MPVVCKLLPTTRLRVGCRLVFCNYLNYRALTFPEVLHMPSVEIVSFGPHLDSQESNQ